MEDDDPVPEKLCEARRQTLVEQINSLKKVIVACCSTMTAVILVVQFILNLYG